MNTVQAPAALPRTPKRAIFYLFYDPQGVVDDYIPYKLERLKPFADLLIVISNGAMNDAGRASLEGIVDEIWDRENIGFDVWGYKTAIERLGDRISEFDELILMNYTWFGPVGDFGPLFERMSAREVDFWGVTDHGAVTPNPFTMEGTLPAHIQSHWIASRRRLLESEDWAAYWRDMPMITSYTDSILQHESRFTRHFSELGYTYEVAYPNENYPGSLHPIFQRAEQLIEEGCPVMKRRPFFHDPLYMDRQAVIGRWILAAAARHGYPEELVLQNMARTAEPRILNTAASLFEILPDQQVAYDEEKPLRLLAAVHIFYEDMTDELLDRLTSLPSSYDLVVTTTSEEKAEFIRERIADRADPLVGAAEVRVLPSNRGRDLSAFFIGTRDRILSGDYDLVVKVHSKKTVQQVGGVGEFFKRQQLWNVLGTPGYTANVIGLFQKHEGLGAVFPPMVHIGFPTMGGAWFTNKEPMAEYEEKLGIHVPLDDISPLAPMGAMWIARPEAMALLFAVEYEYEDYQPETEHGDGSLAHVQERAIAYAAGELGYHVRTISTTDYAAISHTYLEYKLDRYSETVKGDALWAVHELKQRETLTTRIDAGFYSAIGGFMHRKHPGFRKSVDPVVRAIRAPFTRRPPRGGN